MSAHTYSNPRMTATFTDWPSGSYRTTATFWVEVGKRGQRAMRTTVDPKTQRTGKPKATTYEDTVRIVDGDDGRTYILTLVKFRTHITVMQSNLALQEEVIHPRDPRYADLFALVTSV